MNFCKRLIARLDIKGSKLIKGKQFEGVRVLGEPSDFAYKYALNGIDELLYVDSVASLYGRNSLAELLKETSKKIFVPITASGGIRSVDDAAKLLAYGADKIALNTEALRNPSLITELVDTFGSQCVVISIQARKLINSNSWEAMCEMGREKSGKDVFDWITEIQKLGAGEIVLTSVDKDGICKGPDSELIKMASAISTVPLVVGGGFSKSSDIENIFKIKNISAVSIGTALHKNQININNLKFELASKNIPLRVLKNKVPNKTKDLELKDYRIGIIDYGIGNQQSLVNAIQSKGAEIMLSRDTNILEKCDLIALPGVGAFPKSMDQLKMYKLDEFILNEAKKGKSILGICVGMQMLFESSNEFGETCGLGLIKGKVQKLSEGKENFNETLPHMGWNKLLISDTYRNNDYLSSFYQYFLHSFAVLEIEESKILYKCVYGDQTFVAAVKDRNLVGLQFHPERSGFEGINFLTKIIKNIVK